MTRARVLQEVRQMRFEVTLRAAAATEPHDGGGGRDAGCDRADVSPLEWPLSCGGGRGMSRWRIGRLSARAMPLDDVVTMLSLYQTRYTGWTVMLFHERWHTEHGGTRSPLSQNRCRAG